MFEIKNLRKMGIIVGNKVEDKDIIKLTKKVSDLLVLKLPYANLSYLDIYKTLISTKMYYAKISDGLSQANYYYKNSTLYFSDNLSLDKIDEHILHECIHRLQEKKNRKGQIIRLGICEVNELSVKAMALNEGAIQYITNKVLNPKEKTLVINGITINCKTEYYSLLTNIVECLVCLLGEDKLIDSTLNGNEMFKCAVIENFGEGFYSRLDKKTNDIMSNKNDVKQIYFELQKDIYTTYFNNMIKKAENSEDFDVLREKLTQYKKIMGVCEGNNDFNEYCIGFEKNVDIRKQEIRDKKLLLVVKNNFILNLLNKIKKLFSNSQDEYYKQL